MSAGHVVRYGSVRYYGTVRFFLGCKYGSILRYGIFLQVRYGTKVRYFFFVLNRTISVPSSVNTDSQRLANPSPNHPQPTGQRPSNQVCEHKRLAEVNGVSQVT